MTLLILSGFFGIIIIALIHWAVFPRAINTKKQRLINLTHFFYSIPVFLSLNCNIPAS